MKTTLTGAGMCVLFSNPSHLSMAPNPLISGRRKDTGWPSSHPYSIGIEFFKSRNKVTISISQAIHFHEMTGVVPRFAKIIGSRLNQIHKLTFHSDTSRRRGQSRLPTPNPQIMCWEVAGGCWGEWVSNISVTIHTASLGGGALLVTRSYWSSFRLSSQLQGGRTLGPLLTSWSGDGLPGLDA